MCNQFTFHHKFRIDTGSSEFELKTDSILLPVNPVDKSHKDPEKVDLKAPRLAQKMQTAGRNIKTRCIESTSDLLKTKD